LIKAEDLEGKISPDEAESAPLRKEQVEIQVPERRVARYALVEVNQIAKTFKFPTHFFKLAISANIRTVSSDRTGVHVEHILFMIRKAGREVEDRKRPRTF